MSITWSESEVYSKNRRLQTVGAYDCNRMLYQSMLHHLLSREWIILEKFIGVSGNTVLIQPNHVTSDGKYPFNAYEMYKEDAWFRKLIFKYALNAF